MSLSPELVQFINMRNELNEVRCEIERKIKRNQIASLEEYTRFYTLKMQCMWDAPFLGIDFDPDDYRIERF